MVMNECSACPRCGGRLKYYDSVPRLVRTKGRQKRCARLPTLDVRDVSGRIRKHDGKGR